MPTKSVLPLVIVLLQGLILPSFFSYGEPAPGNAGSIFDHTSSNSGKFVFKKVGFVSLPPPAYSIPRAAKPKFPYATSSVLGITSGSITRSNASPRKCALGSSAQPDSEEESSIVKAEIVSDQEIQISEEEQEKIGNLVADEEWNGLSLELADVVRMAVLEDIKKNSRDFLGKDNYDVGDFSKEIDRRVKEEVATMRGKAEGDDYELGDLSIVLDDKVKEMVCEMTGNDEYSFGDLSTEIDKRVKESVANFCGKEEYEFGDLSKELAKRTKEGVLKYTGKENYKFGDITKKAVSSFTGKDDYQFGDVTKKLLGDMFGKKGGAKGNQ